MNPWILTDIAVTNITSKTIVGQGYSMSINVTVENQGDWAETFNVTTYYDSNIINFTTVPNLQSGEEITVIFTWNTIGVAKDNYTIKAVADTIPGETDTTDNTLINGWVVVTIPGDVDGDFDVDLYDAVKLLVVYGVKKDNPKYDPNCDIDGDGSIDLYDAVRLLTHYGEKYP